MDVATLARLTITRGTILLGNFDGIDHQKFFVVLGENEESLVGYFFINSDMHHSLANKPEQFAMQMSISRADYPFLNKNSFSFIGADKLKVINKQKLAKDIEIRETTIKGSLTDTDLTMLLEAVRESKLFSKIEKDTFFK